LNFWDQRNPDKRARADTILGYASREYVYGFPSTIRSLGPGGISDIFGDTTRKSKIIKNIGSFLFLILVSYVVSAIMKVF
jgi:hypothetical protein